MTGDPRRKLLWSCEVATLPTNTICGPPCHMSYFMISTDLSAAPVEPGLAIIRPLRDVMVKAGESVMFECHVIGPQDMDVDWLSDGKLIQPALLNCKMHFDGKRCRLLLNSVHEDDSGTYTCKLSTAKGEHLMV